MNVTNFSSSLHVHANLIVREFMDDYYYQSMHCEGGDNDRDLLAGPMGEDQDPSLKFVERS